MSKIYVDDNLMDIQVEQVIVSKDINVSDTTCTEKCSIERIFTSNIYEYADLSLVFSEDIIYNQINNKVLVYSEDKAYELIVLPDDLEMRIYRAGDRDFIVLAINKDQDILGQVSFCTLMDSGKVTEKQIVFDELRQFLFMDRFLLTNTVEKLTNEKTNTTQYINLLTLYNLNGTIEKYLYENKSEKCEPVEFRVVKDAIFVIDNKKGILSAIKIVNGQVVDIDPSLPNTNKKGEE